MNAAEIERIKRQARAEALNFAIETIKAMRDSYTLDAIIEDLENSREYNKKLAEGEWDE